MNMKKYNTISRTVLSLFVLCLLTGCGGQREARTRASTTKFKSTENEAEKTVVIIFDLSGSFLHLMAEDGVAYQFTLATIDRFLRQTIGEETKLIIAQISASQSPLLWEGRPQDLRRQFPTPQKFRDFLLEQADPNGSRVNEGLSSTLSYLLTHRTVKAGAEPTVLVLSDLMDNAPDGAEYEKQVISQLKELGDKGGAVGLYYVHQSVLTHWHNCLENSGLRDYRVECNIVGHPELPNFE